jgi:hypothetical protein
LIGKYRELYQKKFGKADRIAHLWRHTNIKGITGTEFFWPDQKIPCDDIRGCTLFAAVESLSKSSANGRRVSLGGVSEHSSPVHRKPATNLKPSSQPSPKPSSQPSPKPSSQPSPKPSSQPSANAALVAEVKALREMFASLEKKVSAAHETGPVGTSNADSPPQDGNVMKKRKKKSGKKSKKNQQAMASKNLAEQASPDSESPAAPTDKDAPAPPKPAPKKKQDAGNHTALMWYKRLVDPLEGPALHKELYVQHTGGVLNDNPAYNNHCAGHASLESYAGKKLSWQLVEQYYSIGFIPAVSFLLQLPVEQLENLMVPRKADGSSDTSNLNSFVLPATTLREGLQRFKDAPNAGAHALLFMVWAFLLDVDAVRMHSLNSGDVCDGDPSHRPLVAGVQTYTALGQRPRHVSNADAGKFISVFFNAANPGGIGHHEALFGISGSHTASLPSPKDMMQSMIARLRSLVKATASSDRPFSVSEALLQELEPLSDIQRLQRQVDALTKKVGSPTNPISLDSDSEDDDDDVVAMDPDVVQAAAALKQAKASALLRKQSQAASPQSTGGGSPSRSVSGADDHGTQADDEGEGDMECLGAVGGAAPPLDDVLLAKVLEAAEAVVRADPCDDVTFDTVFGLEGSAAVAGKEGKEARDAAVTAAVTTIRAKLQAIVLKTKGSRTRDAKELLRRLHFAMRGNEPANQLVLLRAYAPILQPLLPVKFKFYDESTLTESGVLEVPAAKAIADLAKAPMARV